MKYLFIVFMLLICVLFAAADKETAYNETLNPAREIKITGDIHGQARRQFEFEVEKVLFEKLIEYKNDILKDSLSYKVYHDPYPIPTLDGFIQWLEKDLKMEEGNE